MKNGSLGEYDEKKSFWLLNKNVDYNAVFGGLSGCAVIWHPQDDRFEVYNREMCVKQASPCSTFKIITALMGLNNNVIENEK
ncbi:hypothetical protein MCG44_00240 [Lawsonibacter sp. OA9]|uniref:penicillin-binding transpeptidase domain-containing protein n=1 Tax=Oscillospiraceae TaxID=216572 RepID=UPI001F062F89|nr:MULTISPECIES: penicillin-binding transpeptidase domain-containing protein [Oscillospiraceae]MCH1978184.1 hypothetical protein [Lawsonibacter sp. OA9]MCH1981182.1 hypothetical protein [Ruminococcus sp. OA3]